MASVTAIRKPLRSVNAGPGFGSGMEQLRIEQRRVLR
jgi:hypothetical protein